MPAVRIAWSSLLNLTELDFIPEAPKVLKLSDEMIQSLSWLTATTGHDRRLLRCTKDGALLIADAWSNMVVVENDELYPGASSPDTFTATKVNKGVLIASSTQLILAECYKTDDSDYDRVYIPPGWLYFCPVRIYRIIVSTVPYDTGTASYVGITAFN